MAPATSNPGTMVGLGGVAPSDARPLDPTDGGAGGHDTIRAADVGRAPLDGGAGDDAMRLSSAAPGSILLDGEGDDRIRGDALASVIYGGAGDDRFLLREDTAGATVIADAEGHNRLRLDADAPLGFERVEGSDGLRILLGGGGAYERSRDVVWVDFFANPGNRVNGLRTTAVADLTVTTQPPPQPPAELTPTVPQFINAANWTYSRDEGNLPAGLRPLLVDGEHLTREVTGSGFYGAAFLTPANQVIVAFEGTHLSTLEEDPEFVFAQIAADAQLYLGEVPAAFGDTYAFTLAALTAAED